MKKPRKTTTTTTTTKQRMCLLLAFATSTSFLFRPIACFSTSKIPAVALGRAATLSTLYASSSNSNKPSQNPSFSSMIGDMASSLLGGGDGLATQPQVDEKLRNLTPTWEDIRKELYKQQTPEEREFRDNLKMGYGVDGSPLHKIRLFVEKNKEDDVRVVFYRDSASWCPYCQKCWLTLEEKQIPYKVEKINMRCYGDKPATFTRLQPSGQIPVAVIDGKVYGQSNDILYQLEELFPDHKSLKPPVGHEARAQELLRLERKLFSAWMYWLTSGNDPEDFRAMFVDTLREVEAALKSSGPFFLGPDVTIVDFQFAPFLERMAASLLYFKGFQIRVAPGEATDYPSVNKWFDAMETLPSYQLTKSDYYTHCWDLPPQLGGCVSEPAGAPYEQAINGERTMDGQRGSWELPLQAHNGGMEPDWDWAGDESSARREAVERMSANAEAIARFAARGAGRKGMPPYLAPLADPNATPSDAVQEAVGACLRVVCSAMLDGSTNKQDETMKIMARTLVDEGGSEFATGVIDSLVYLRDRVGVPRDMKLPAARQLRAHLNWSIGRILDETEP